MGEARVVDDGMSEHIIGTSYNTDPNGTGAFASRDLMQSGMEMAQRVRDVLVCISAFSRFIYVAQVVMAYRCRKPRWEGVLIRPLAVRVL